MPSSRATPRTLLKASPAPAVSTTFTWQAVICMTSPRSRASTPPPLRVIITVSGPRLLKAQAAFSALARSVAFIPLTRPASVSLEVSTSTLAKSSKGSSRPGAGSKMTRTPATRASRGILHCGQGHLQLQPRRPLEPGATTIMPSPLVSSTMVEAALVETPSTRFTKPTPTPQLTRAL